MTYDAYRQWRTTPIDGSPDLTVVIPAYDEAQRIVPTIAAIAAHVCSLGRTWELVVADDGSTDGTPELVEALGLRNCRVVGDGVNRGKGHAVRSGIEVARGRMVLFSDADLSTPIEQLGALVAAIEGGADVAVGSRAGGQAGERRSLVRRAMSAVLHVLVRVLFPVGVSDSQCGFKLFTAEAAARLVEAQTIDGFSFDLELLWVAHRLGLDVAEVPVEWVEAPGSKVDPAREAVRFVLDMGRIRHRHRGRVARTAAPASGAGLRLGVVTPHPPSPRTLNEYGFHLVRELAAKPDLDEVVLLCDDESAGARPDGVTVVPCWRFDSIRNPLRILRAVRRQRPDVVLFNIQFASFGSGKVAAALGLLTPALLRLAGVPTVVLLHNLVDTVDLDTAGFTANPVARRALTGIGRVLTRVVLRAERVAVTIPGYVDLLQERYGATNVYLAPHGSFGTGELPPTSVPERPRLLTFGKFGTYKRVEELVDAYRSLLVDIPDLELVIAGTDSPNSPGYLESVAAATADLPGLSFTGYVAEEDVAGLFRSSTVVVFPYTGTTGSSGPLHQAGEHGRAVVLPAIGDFLAVIEEEGYTGETFEPGDAASLAAALRRLLTDDRRRAAIASRNASAAAGLPIGHVADLHVLHCLTAAA